MTIGIDLRCLPTDGSAGAGVAHAARFLMEALLKKEVPWTWQLYVPVGAHGNAPGPMDTIRTIGSKGVSPYAPTRNQSGAALRETLRLHPCDLLFVPGGSVAPAISIPQLPWVHDVAIFRHPEWFPQNFFRRTVTTHLFRRGVMKAPLVFAVSNDTASELENQFGLDATKIRVTHAGGDPFLAALHGDVLHEAKKAAKTRIEASGITNSFIVAMGTVEPRKNLSTLITAWRDARSSFSRPIDLVIAGRDGWKMDEIHSGAGLHRVSILDDATRHDLLLAADLVALPSLHEGFGLVALEAMQAETALIASRSGAIPEVVGEEGILLDPQDVKGWSSAMIELMNDDGTRQKVALAGKARSQGFMWEQAAEVVKQGIVELLKI